MNRRNSGRFSSSAPLQEFVGLLGRLVVGFVSFHSSKGCIAKIRKHDKKTNFFRQIHGGFVQCPVSWSVRTIESVEVRIHPDCMEMEDMQACTAFVKRAPKPRCCSLYQTLASRISFRAAGRMTMLSRFIRFPKLSMPFQSLGGTHFRSKWVHVFSERNPVTR